MRDLTTVPLVQLLHLCSPLTQPLSPEAEIAWQELQRRALCEQSDAAWDALVARLWPAILRWVYERAPDIAPAVAEQLVQQIIGQFRAYFATQAAGAVALNGRLFKELLRRYVAGWFA